MSAQTGLAAINADVLSAVNDMIGRIVLFNTVDDRRWSGVLSAIGDDFEFGFELVVQVTKENENDLFRKEKDIIEKMIVPFEDIVDFAYVTEEDKKNQFVSKFATDRQYHGSDANGDDDLEEWNGGDEDEGTGGAIEDDAATAGSQSSRRSNHNNAQAGWSAADMFAANENQVKSTFKEDLTQYTTADIVGNDEDRARAERLAREIESNSSSRFMANLENDDDERDLDKITRQEDFDNGNGRGGKRNNYNQPPQQRRNPNITPNGQPVNRRAEGLRGDRRNSGGSSANNSRYGPPAPAQNYQQQQPPQQGQKGGSHNNRRQNEEYREPNDWQMAKGKGQNQGQDHSFRQQQKQMLDPRPSAKQPEGEKGQSSGSRVTEMKKWGNEFSLGTPPKEQSPAPGSTPPAPQGNSGNAWNRGPPSSLVAKGTTAESSLPAADKEQEEVSKTVTSRKEEAPSTSEEGRTEIDGRHEEGDNESVHSETASVATTKSQSFKFNINAPEFKPRVAPTTPTPTTPTGPPPQNLAQIPHQQQYVPPEYQQHPGMIQHGGPLMGMPPAMASHMPPGAVAQNPGQPIMMWQGQPGYQHNQQYQMQQAPGVPGQMYGQAASAPITANQQAMQNPQMAANTSGGSQADGRPPMQQMRRDGEYRESQPLYYPSYNQQGQLVPVPPQYYNSQYPGAMQQQPYQVKMVSQQGPQGNYQQRYQQTPQQVYMGPPQGQPSQQHRYQGGPPQQTQQFTGDQGAQQSHPNSQPTTPGPRGGEMNGQKGQQQATPQTQSNSTTNGMHREPEAGSNASLSGSASSQSGQRSGSPHTNVAVPPQQPQQQQPPPQHQQGPPHGGPQHGGPQHSIPPHVGQVQGSLVGVPQHPMGYMVVPPHQMHPQMSQYYSQQQPGLYYSMPQMMPVQHMSMQPNQHGQQSLMGERADNGFSQNNYFDYRNMPNYQQNQQQHQMHGNQMPRQNSIPQQQFGGNQGVNPGSQQVPPPAAQQQQPPQQQQGGPPPPREQQQQKAQSPQ